MDRQELDQKIRARRPGERTLRRGSPPEKAAAEARSTGYVPFTPEPDDARALREPDPDQPEPNADNTPADFDRPIQGTTRADDYPEPYQQPSGQPPYGPPPPYEPPSYEPDAYGPAEDETPYGAPEDAYPYPAPSYAADDGRRRGGSSSALPIIGFIVLCVLALGVGAVVAGMLGGNGGVGQATATPSVTESAVPSEEPTEGASGSTSGEASATPEPTDGPITFPDGALLSIQTCGSGDYDADAVGHPEQDACEGDGSTLSGEEAWAFVVFSDASRSDNLTMTLRLGNETVNEQELVLGSVLDECGATCNGLIYGSHYVDLPEGEYTVTLQRNGSFADSASFTVEG
jgi:hypothetical protein